jgi:hypothetical protein
MIGFLQRVNIIYSEIREERVAVGSVAKNIWNKQTRRHLDTNVITVIFQNRIMI